MCTDQNSAKLNRSELLATALLAVLIVLVFVPLLARWVPTVFDDCPIESLPGLITTARSIQNGALPLWDFQTFSGAKPPYADNIYMAFYLPMYPFFLLVDTNDATHCHTWLMLVPLMLHLAWAALGGYLFGRLILRVDSWSAMLLGLVYGLSPDMAFQILTPSTAVLLSYLPWCLLALSRFLQSGSVWWWLCGTLFLALMNSVGTANYLIRALFVMSCTVTLLWLLELLAVWRQRDDLALAQNEIGGNSSYGRTELYRLVWRLAGAYSVFLIGIGLAAVSWSGTFEAASWIQHAIGLSTETAAWFAGESSMPPLNAVSLFVPGFFGDFAPSHRWGIGHLFSAPSIITLGGGLFMATAVVSAILKAPSSGKTTMPSAEVRRWTVTAVFVCIASLLTMMGGYTPVFKVLCVIAPKFFQFPHPAYYRFGVCWSVAILVAIGMWRLRSSGTKSIATKDHWRRASLLTIGLALMSVLIGLSLGNGDPWPTPAGYLALSIEAQWRWFLAGPIAQFVVSAILLLVVALSPLIRRRRLWLSLGIVWNVLQVFLLMTNIAGRMNAAQSTHHATGSSPNRIVEHDRLYAATRELDQLAARRDCRFSGTRSILDNAAWYGNSRALMGYSSKPLIPWYEEMIQQFTSGTSEIDFNERLVMWIPESLLQNMNVGYLISRFPVELEAPARAIVTSDEFTIYELPEFLPYAYMQDRVLPQDTEKQLKVLFTSDLREAVYVDPATQQELVRSISEMPSEESNPTARFEQLQRTNVIQRVERSTNRTTIEANVKQKSMLVISECWHAGWTARINGRAAKVHRVNFLQQGIWLEPGKHVVQLQFFPPSLRVGILFSSLSAFIVLAALVTAIRRSHRDCKRERSAHRRNGGV